MLIKVGKRFHFSPTCAIPDRMDKRRQLELTAALVDRKTMTCGGKPLREPYALVALSPGLAMDYTQYKNLQFHEKRWIKAIAVGQGMRKAVLAGRSAARALGMWVVATDANEPVELLLPAGKPPSKSQWPPGIVYLEPRNRPAGVRELDTVRATDELTTAFEIALRHGFREGLVAMDWVLQYHTSLTTIEEEAAKLGRVRGIDTLRKVIKYAVSNSRSPYESYARAILIERVPGDWIVNEQFAGFEVDLRCGWFIVEIDGDFKYDGVTFKPTDDAIRQERQREKRLLKAGAVLLRVSPRQLLFNEDEFVADAQRLMEVAERVAQHGAGETPANPANPTKPPNPEKRGA